jgi:hypothetical protein
MKYLTMVAGAAVVSVVLALAFFIVSVSVVLLHNGGM